MGAVDRWEEAQDESPKKRGGVAGHPACAPGSKPWEQKSAVLADILRSLQLLHPPHLDSPHLLKSPQFQPLSRSLGGPLRTTGLQAVRGRNQVCMDSTPCSRAGHTQAQLLPVNLVPRTGKTDGYS